MAGRLLGIDVSKWQGVFDYSKAKSKGVRFVIFKGTDVGSATGVGFVDVQADNNYKNAKKENLIVGSYCWMDATRDGKYQAEYYLNNIYNKYKLDLPPVLDFEDVAGLNNPQLFIQYTREWLQIVEDATKKIPIIYTASWYTNRYNQALLDWMGRYYLWVAMYANVSKPLLPRQWNDYKIWQYADNASYPYYTKSGGNGKAWGSQSVELDMNWFNGDYNELLEFCNKESEPEPEPQALFKAECIVGALTVREGPGTNYKATGRYLKKGDVVNVFEVTNNWFRIAEGQWVSGYPTYMKKITEPVPPTLPSPEPEPEPTEPLYKAEVTATAGLRVRSAPVIDPYNQIEVLLYKTIVDVYEESNGWSKISPTESRWCMSQWLKRVDDNPLPPIVEKYYGALYWQRDPRWKDKPLGTSGTIGAYGCVMTAETNVLNQLGIVTNPVANNAWRTAHGGYHNGNLIVWERVSEQHPDIIWEGKTWNPTDAQIKQKIDSGCPVIMLVDHNEGTAALNEHWVNSIPSPVDDNAIWIHDPWDNVTIKLRDRYKKPIQQFSSYHKKV